MTRSFGKQYSDKMRVTSSVLNEDHVRGLLWGSNPFRVTNQTFLFIMRLYIGNCAILSAGEDIQTIPQERVEGFSTTAESPEEAIQNVRDAFNADELECEHAVLEVVIIASMEENKPVFLSPPYDWELFVEEKE